MPVNFLYPGDSGKGARFTTYFFVVVNRRITLATLSVSIPQELKNWIDKQVAAGQFNNASEFLCDLVQKTRDEREALKAALIEGENSGFSDKTIPEIIAERKKFYKRNG